MGILTKRTRPTEGLAPALPSLARMRYDMDRMFDRFFEGNWDIEAPVLRSEGWAPALDVSENDKEVTIRAEIPGVDPKDVDVSITGSTLTISGEKKQETEQKGEDYYRCERSFGVFKRAVTLPETIDPNRVSAEHEHGVIVIHAAKQPTAKPRHIEIKPGKAVTGKPTQVPVGTA